jgi:hypothetical protein
LAKSLTRPLGLGKESCDKEAEGPMKRVKAKKNRKAGFLILRRRSILMSFR